VIDRHLLPNDLRDKVGSSIPCKESITREIFLYCSEKYNNVVFCGLFGSFARGDHIKLSDIDFIIILNNDDHISRRQIVRDGNLFQYMIIGINNVSKIFEQERVSGYSYLLSAFSDMQLCFGDKNLFLSLKNESLRIRAEGPALPSKSQTNALVRNSVNSYLKLLRYRTDHFVSFGARLNLYSDLIVLMQANIMVWVEPPDRAHINLRNNADYIEIVATMSIDPALAVDRLLAVTKRYLIEMGQFVWTTG